MSFLYPRTIDVHRAETVAAGSPNIGLVGYSGMAQGAGSGGSGTLGETVIATGIPCTIQPKGGGNPKGRGLVPADAPGPPQWAIYIPLSANRKPGGRV